MHTALSVLCWAPFAVFSFIRLCLLLLLLTFCGAGQRLAIRGKVHTEGRVCSSTGAAAAVAC